MILVWGAYFGVGSKGACFVPGFPTPQFSYLEIFGWFFDFLNFFTSPRILGDSKIFRGGFRGKIS